MYSNISTGWLIRDDLIDADGNSIQIGFDRTTGIYAYINGSQLWNIPLDKNTYFNMGDNNIRSYPSSPGVYRTVGTNVFSSLRYEHGNYGVLVILQAIYGIHIYVDNNSNIFWGYSGDTFQEPSTWYSWKFVDHGTSLPPNGSTGCVFFLKST